MLLSHRSYGSNKKKVIILLTGWKTGFSVYRPFVMLFTLLGYRSIVYVYGKEILSPNLQQTAENFSQVVSRVHQDLQQLQKEGYTSICLFGISLGTVFAIKLANISPVVTSLILNLTGASIANSIWNWKKRINAYFYQTFQSRNITLQDLEQTWREFNPIENIDNLAKKKILLFIAMRDEIIPFSEGTALVVAMKEKGYNPKIYINQKGNHLIAAITNLFRLSTYRIFLG